MNYRNVWNLYLHVRRIIGIYLLILFLAGIGLLILYFNNVTSSKQTIQSRASENTSKLKVMTYNIHETYQKPGEMESLAKYLKDNAIDVVGLQALVEIEDDDKPDYSDEEVLVRELDRIGYSMQSKFWRYGGKIENGSETKYMVNALLSRYPITSYEFKSAQRFIYGFQTFTISHPAFGAIRFINIHPWPGQDCTGTSGRVYCPDQAIYEMLDYANTFPEKKILLGDFNSHTFDPSFPTLLLEYEDACLNSNVGSICSIYMIDHIVYEKNREFVLESAKLDFDYPWSDHNPFIATFTVNPPPKGYLGTNEDVCTKIQGWTCDASDFSKTVNVNFYKEVNGQKQLLLPTPVPANLQKGDANTIAELCGGNGSRRFEVQTPVSVKTGQNVKIYAQAVDIPSGNKVDLINSPRTINCPAPTATSVPVTPTKTPTRSPTPTKTNTPTPSKTNTPSPTKSPTPTKTPTPTLSPTKVPTTGPGTPTYTPSPTKTKTPTPTQIPTQSLACIKVPFGDINCDTIINSQDYGCWAYEVTTGQKSIHCSFTADISKNKIVDILDFSIIKSNIGK